MAEVHNTIFNLKNNNALRPNGLGPSFFQFFWSIIKEDVYNITLQFFKEGWIIPIFKSNIMVLIPKVPYTDRIEHFGPIEMENSKQKNITKILADSLTKIIPHIISQEHKVFIHGRSIKDCICLASEVANLLHNKSFGGNIAMKVDISKDFNTPN